MLNAHLRPVSTVISRVREALSLTLLNTTALPAAILFTGSPSLGAEGLRVNYDTNAEQARLQTVDGPELVQPAQWTDRSGTNGIFTNDAGVLSLTNNGGVARAAQAIPVVVGRSYRIAATATNAVTLDVWSGGYGTGSLLSAAAATSHDHVIVATTPFLFVQFGRTTFGAAAVVSGITIRNAVPVVGFDNGPTGEWDCWNAARVGVGTYANSLTVGDRTFTATKTTGNVGVALNLYPRPGATYRVRYTVPSGANTYAIKQGANGSGGTLTSGTSNPTQTAFTFVATHGVMSILWDNANSYTVSNIYVEEVSATAPIGAAPRNLLTTSGWTASTGGGTAAASATSAGVITVSGDGVNTGRGDQSFTTVAGRTYRIYAKVETNTAGVWVGTAQGGSSLLSSSLAAGVGTLTFTATGTTTWLRMFRLGSGNSIISDIEVREVGLVSNGDFPSATTGWTLYNSTGTGLLSVSSGRLVVANNSSGTYSRAVQALSLTVGKTYRLLYDFTKISGNGYIRVGTAADGGVANVVVGLSLGSTTVSSTTFTATAATMYLSLWLDSSVTTDSASYDNIVVEEIAEQGQGSLIIEFKLPALDAVSRRVFQITDGTTSNVLLELYAATGATLLASGAANTGTLGTIVAGTIYRLAVTWGYDSSTGKRFVKASLNGGAMVTLNPTTLAQVGRLDLMNRPTLDRAGNGYVRRLSILTRANNDNWPAAMSRVNA